MLALLLACAHSGPGPSQVQAEPKQPTAFELELQEATRQLTVAQSRAERLQDWGAYAHLAGLARDRARLSGDYSDYTLAEQAIEQAFAMAPEGSGPFVARAALNATVHRVDRVEADLLAAQSAVLVSDNKRAGLTLMRANVAFQRGEYESAMQGYDAALALHPSVGGFSSRANALSHLGELQRAEQDFDRAEALYHGVSQEPLAWLDLQRGLMDLAGGRYDQALAHYQDADAHLRGYWLVQEHMAEIYVLQGDNQRARVLYGELVERTQNPEFMDALAALSSQEEAALWTARAGEIYEQRLLTWPQASWGHALNHFLNTQDGPRALELAQANAALRPGVDSQTKLAQAWLLMGEPAQALAVLEPCIEGPWVGAELSWTAAQSYQAMGMAPQAQAQRAAALALNADIAR